MKPPATHLNPAEAARRLGVSAKALRVYEERGLLAPLRSEARWRSYGPAEMARAGEIVALRQLGFSLGQVARVLSGASGALEAALAAWLRRGGPDRRPLFLLTRSTAILDLEAVGPDETIIVCPANHSPPARVAPYPGAPGYEAVATCLASPEVRVRTAGVIAWRPRTARGSAEGLPAMDASAPRR